MSGQKEYDIWTLIALLGHQKHREHWNTRADEIRRRLQRGEDPNAGRESPLAMAATMGHLDIVKVLLEFGADVQGGCSYRTPLLCGIQHPEIRDYLLLHGATETIFTIVASGNADRIKEYISKDQSLVHLRDEGGMTPLFIATANHDLASMALLLRAGADPNAIAIDSYGISPIHEACRGQQDGSRRVIELLVENNASLNAQDKGGVTALHMAVRDRNVEAVRTLLENGAEPDLEDRGRKSTPLRRAVANTGRQGTGGKTEQAIEIVDLLLGAGANPNHVNRSGKVVIESTRNDTIRGMLRNAMDKRND